MNKGVYIHVPFCVKKCAYCDFYSVGGTSPEVREEYSHTLIKHIEMSRDKSLICDSIYFGGGTPSLMEPEWIDNILCALGESFSVASDCEITLEANPETFDLERLQGYRKAGVNRLSMGVQSLDDRSLSALGRIHTSSRVAQAVNEAAEAGFENISCDIMFGIPHQTPKTLSDTLTTLCTFPVTHISAYGLKIEEGTPFSKSRPELPDEDAENEMYFMIANTLEKEGFEQYEISNFAKNGAFSRHNMKYWQGDEYISFGPCAASYLDGQRYTYERSLERYTKSIQNGKNPPESERYTVDEEERKRERIIFGLRLSRGISLEKSGLCEEKLNSSAVIRRLVNEKYMVIENGILRLTKEGFRISNAIINEVLDISYM